MLRAFPGRIVISLAPGTKVYLASKSVSMRLVFDGLAALVPPPVRVEPYGGHVFLFRSKSGNHLKALCRDGTGLCPFAKRLERSRFLWPPLIDGVVVLTSAQFALLIEAMDWRRTVLLTRPVCRSRFDAMRGALPGFLLSGRPDSAIGKRVSQRSRTSSRSRRIARFCRGDARARLVASEQALEAEWAAHNETRESFRLLRTRSS